MDHRVSLVSACAACLAVVLIGLYPGLLSFNSHGGAGKLDINLNDESCQGITDHAAWDIKYHLGGDGPWVPKMQGIVNDTIDPPEGW